MRVLVSTILSVGLLAGVTTSHAGSFEQNEAMFQRYMDFGSLVKGGQVTPHWILGGPSFWYAEGGPQDRVIQLVDPVKDMVTPLFDVARLRAALTEELGFEPAGQGVPFAMLSVVAPGQVAFSVENVSLLLKLADYSLTRQPAPFAMSFSPYLVSELERVMPQTYFKESFNGLGPTLSMESPSPDGQWFARIDDNNVVLRATIDGRKVALTRDGNDTEFWDVESTKWSAWSPDAQRLVVTKHDTTGMARISTVKWLKPLEEAIEVLTIPAGGVLNRQTLYILNVQGGAPVEIDLGDTTDQYLRPLAWLPDGSALIFARYDRLLTQVEIMRADAESGKVKVLMTEKSKTFLTNQHETIWAADTGFWLLPDGSGFIWRSERDGWDHLYLYNINGRQQRRLTRGDFPVIDVTQIDQPGGWVYFQAHGDLKRPYDNHLYRVRLKGGGFKQLTQGEGRHTISMAPSGSHFVDTYSSVANPPQTVLRSASGKKLRELGRADISRLQAVGWTPSREVVIKAADGKTDLWVTINFPYDFDPSRKYPLVEHIYAGPQTTWRVMDFGVATGFAASYANFNRALAQHGFITVTLDGRGTPGRSKAFHDAVYRNWGQFEIKDHGGAIRQLAQRFDYIDLDRVGITGGSWGGHFTLRALTQDPELYKVGISEVPGYDSRAFTLYEIYLGMPASNKDVYDAADALALAPLLKGKLLQTGGINDTGTQKDLFRMSEALIRLGKQHENMIYPNAGHGFMGASGRYNNELKKNWFIEQLHP